MQDQMRGACRCRITTIFVLLGVVARRSRPAPAGTAT
jgi:hypothetical protein